MINYIMPIKDRFEQVKTIWIMSSIIEKIVYSILIISFIYTVGIVRIIFLIYSFFVIRECWLAIYPYDNKGEWVPIKVRWKHRLQALAMMIPVMLLDELFNFIG